MHSRIIKIFLPLAFLTVILWGCLERIDLEVDPEFQFNTVIQGKLVQGNPSTVFVRVSRLFDFTFNGRASITVRYVRLFDDQGNQVDLERGDAIGDYVLELPEGDPRMQIEEGRSYFIEVATFDGGVFRSEAEAIQPVPDIADLEWEPIQKEFLGVDGELRNQPFVEFQLTTPLDVPTEEVYLRWVSERTIKLTDTPESDVVPDNGQPNKTCYITESGSVSIIPVGSSTTFAGEIVDFPVYQEPRNYRFAEGYMLTVYQESLNRKAYEYWRDIGTLINREGTIFEPPVGQVQSNIINTQDDGIQPFGYFYVTQQDTARIYVSPEEAENPMMQCPIPPPQMPPPGFQYCEAYSICCDCLSVPGSQLDPPDFWIE